jgi:hypothetical protein
MPLVEAGTSSNGYAGVAGNASASRLSPAYPAALAAAVHKKRRRETPALLAESIMLLLMERN